MKIKDYKCKCEHDDFFFVGKGNQKGIYCSYCGKWYKWADKDEQNLSIKQEPKTNVLDKIRAEIEEIKLDVDLDIGNEMIYNNAIKDVLEIIDKYRGE